MPTLVLVISLDDDQENHLLSHLRHYEGQHEIKLLQRDDVIVLSPHAIAFDASTAHDAYIAACHELLYRRKPHLIAHVDTTVALLVGATPERVSALHRVYGVPCVPPATS